MLFNSLTFLIFISLTYGLFRLLPGWVARKRLLLVASYIFYAAWNPPYVLILLASTTLDWWLARRIWHCRTQSKRKALLIVSLAANLGVLGFFKYSGFLLHNFQLLAHALGIVYQPPAMNIILPIGISFYTFASLSYTIDVYRNEVRGDWRFLDYALFVSLFPHLVAGPIVRAYRLLPQIAEPRTVSSDQLGWGVVLVCLGLFAKTVLADSVFAPVVDQVFANPAAYGAGDIWAAVLGFSGQIYFDFSGYSLCAVGLALCFGIAFPDNFHFPYAARGFSDFWRRWHISLSTWLRDYLYISLGGNRLSAGRTLINLMLTMLIGGLWHGASWMFVLWGGLHGIYLVTERWLSPVARKGAAALRPMPVRTLLTFLLVTLAWIPFRAHDPGTAWEIVTGLVRSGHDAAGLSHAVRTVYLAIGLTVVSQYFLRDTTLEQSFGKLGEVPQMLILGSCLIVMYLYSGGNEHAFIYFQF